MSLTAREVAQLLAALEPLRGGIVQKVSLPEPCSVFLELRKPGHSYLLAICAASGRSRLHLATHRPASPARPFALQGYLRGALTGASLLSFESPPGERMAWFRFLSPSGPLSLVAELTGRHGNLFALDADETIRATGLPNHSKLRGNLPGARYTPPIPRDPLPASETTSRFADSLSLEALSEAIERLYLAQDQTLWAAQRRRELLAPLQAQARKLERTIEKVRGDEARAADADLHRRRGELLKQNLGRLRPGQREALLTEYTAEGVHEVTIALDPSRTPAQNVEREFHQYKRLQSGQLRARERREQLERELERLRAALASIEADESSGEPGENPVAPGPRPASPGRPTKPRLGPRLPYREYLSESGQRIRVGRSAADNEALTFRIAKGNDLWLHARGGSGSHVVIPLAGEPLQETTLRDAALLAAHFSELRDRGQVDVAWTRAKYVRKVKGAVGAVVYSQEKTWWSRSEPERLAKLLQTVDTPGQTKTR